jgi:subtilisin family serine protease
MIKLLNISFTGMVSIKILSFITLAVFALSDVVAAPGYVQKSGSKYIQQKQLSTIKAKFVAGEVLVKFKSNVAARVQQYTATNLGGRSFTPVGNKLRVAKIKLQEGSDVIAAVQAYQADANVEYAQPNYIYYATAIPNDASYSQLWGINNTGQTISNPSYPTSNPGIAGNDIDAESAWDQITDCRPALVAVLDTGINYTHQDLVLNLWDGLGLGFPNHGWDFIDNDNDPMPTSAKEDHGTHIAGTIGASGNNGIGVAGVCWRASIMSVRVLDAAGGTTASVIQGIEFASDNGAKVINMSLSGEVSFDSLASDAITYARGLDVVVVVAAGNGGDDGVGDDNDGLGDDGDANTIEQPCNFTQDNLLCIAALDQSYNLASFSNFGATSVDVGAPGTNTLSSWAGQIITDDFTSGWTLSGGWAFGVCSGFNILSNPANWCSVGGYPANIDDRAYKSFNLSGATAAELDYAAQIDTETGFDFFFTAMISSGGDPHAGGGTLLQSGSGSTSNLLLGFNHDISSCNTSTCSLGFRLTSDAFVTDFGVGIVNFTIETLQTNSTIYNVINGTSMASPHVAGIATMVRAFNPSYTYTQTVEAIKNGGEVVSGLSGITTTGRAANAMGAIAYITEPTGLVAVVQ